MTVFTWPVRIYYEDTDAGGVVYHANYLKFFERGRTEMLREKGFEQDQLKINEGIIFAIRSLTIDYLSLTFFNDLIEVHSKISCLKKASLIFDQSIHRGDTLLSKATITVVCLDAKTMRPKALPQTLLAEFQ
ncbi:MAG: tol-pal system-associated acyl-CoA thioesterase [Methylococcales bacterium]|nr:tol-pal system-associated acyl-CoA thioesterase [Methylococcales bacterium]